MLTCLESQKSPDDLFAAKFGAYRKAFDAALPQAALPGSVSCRIGLEANMTPADYPMVRIVPSIGRYGAMIAARQCELLIYVGLDVHEFEAGLEALYQQLFAMEAAVIDAALAGGDLRFSYIETIFDEDRVDAFKLIAIRGAVELV